jgi:Tfp pilus assembly protein FimT
MKRDRRNARGYSLAEILTVVAIAGMVALVSLPALFQLLPQYRVRGASTELSAALRMARQDAIGQRRPYRVTIDSSGRRYAISTLTTPGAAMTVSTNWSPIGENNRPVPTGSVWWKQLTTGITISTTGFLDVDCANGTDVIFLRDGSISPMFNSGCAAGGSANIDFTTLPNIRVYYPSRYVNYNAYYIYGSSGGNLTTSQAKE